MTRSVSVLGLMAAVLAAGLALAALRAGSFAWLRAMYTATAFALLWATLASRYSRDAFWFGFAAFGWGYFLLGVGPFATWVTVHDPAQGTILQPSFNPIFPNAYLLERLALTQASHLKPSPLPDAATFQDAVAHNAATQSHVNVIAITKGMNALVFAWFFAGLGGLMARQMMWRLGRHEPGHPNVHPGR